MIGILVIAHAPLASALAHSAAHVYECAPELAANGLRVLDIAPGTDVPATVAQARQIVAELDYGSGVLVLTDAFGATPGNIAVQLNQPGKVAVVAGINLPMLLRVLCYREGTLAESAEKAVSGGTQGVLQVAATSVQNQIYKPQGHDLARLQDQQ